jgi:hydrogenase maturation protease
MSARLLVAGVGNIFLADDAFGPEVIRALGRRPLVLPGCRSAAGTRSAGTG